MTNSSGSIEAEQSFDAWGRRRNPSTWAFLSPVAATGLPVWLYRGYTGHEHLDQFGLINMNGRMYDPVLGRMLSPDNFIPNPLFSQDYNRYTYARNNPLIYTDPDGNFVITAAVLLGVAKAVGIGAAIGAVSYTASVGLSNGGFNNWNWGQLGKSVGMGAISGAVSFGVGSAAGALKGIGKLAVQTAGHAAWGGASSVLNGGSFGSGAAIGAFSNWAGGITNGMGAGVQLGTSTLMGGIVAEATGGNFWHGAAVGGIVAGANHLMHENSFKSQLRKAYNELKEKSEFALDFSGGFKDFYDTYMEMRDANLKDSDKYFHSKANYNATLRGDGGEYAAEKLSNLREFLDQRWPKFDTYQNSMDDQKANVYGRTQGRHYRLLRVSPSYDKAIPKYRKNYFGNH